MRLRTFALAATLLVTAVAPLHAQLSVYASRAWTQANTPTVPVGGFGVSIGRQWVVGYEDVQGTAIRVDSPYGGFTYCDANRPCPPQRTSVHQGFRSAFIGRRFDLGSAGSVRLAVMPKIAASFVRETRSGLESTASLSGDQGSLTAGIAVEGMRVVYGRWSVLLSGEARRQIREPSPCIDCHTPFPDGFNLQQLSIGVFRGAR